MPERTGGAPSATEVPIAYHESLTDLSGLVEGAFISTVGTLFCISRKNDWLSPQFAAALASGRKFNTVTIHTPSGHVVQILFCWLYNISKTGFGPPFGYPGAPTIRPGCEGITWTTPNSSIFVDGVPQGETYNWLGLNS